MLFLTLLRIVCVATLITIVEQVEGVQLGLGLPQIIQLGCQRLLSLALRQPVLPLAPRRPMAYWVIRASSSCAAFLALASISIFM